MKLQLHMDHIYANVTWNSLEVCCQKIQSHSLFENQYDAHSVSGGYCDWRVFNDKAMYDV